MVQIEGSTVVVTGGQRGLGKAIVDELLERGAAKVHATARALFLQVMNGTESEPDVPNLQMNSHFAWSRQGFESP